MNMALTPPVPTTETVTSNWRESTSITTKLQVRIAPEFPNVSALFLY